MNQTPPQDRRTQPAQAARPSGGAGTALKEPAAARARAAQPQGGPEGVMIVTATQDAAPPRPAFDDEWRRWIAENLLLGIPANAVLATLCRTGFDRQAAEHEVILASQSPYLRGAEQLRNRLAKREWQLGVYRKLNRLHPRSGEVERRHKLSRDEFLEQYYSTNRPVIITGMMEDWPALRKWSLDYFDQRFGDREIEVQFGRTGDNYEVEREKFIKKMKFSEYTDLIRSAGTTNDFYLTANNTSHNRAALPELWEDVVHVPEYLDTSSHEPGFFWLGPPGTITPFHHDLTNNFMAQVMGRKRVKLVPSWDLPMMQNTFHCYSRVDGRVTPASPHPEFREPQVVECILGPGEILFLPIGGLHFVEGLDVSATVSFINFVFDNDFHSFYSTYHKV